jgi:uncharacterized protein (TIGR00369 family)
MPDALPTPFHDLIGFDLAEWRDGFARLVCETGLQHTNRSGIVHGGVLLSMMDQAAAYAGLWSPDPAIVRRGMTIDFDCRFTGQVSGGRVTAEARVVSAGRNIYFCRTEAFDGEGKLVAFGASTHRWRDGSQPA